MHSGLINFINRQYGSDESGCWFLQNGPQRVFVSLACTPWIFRRQNAAFTSHTDQPAGTVHAIYLDEEGNILLATELGIGLLDDRDLTQFLAECRDATGQTPDEQAFLELMNGHPQPIFWQKTAILPIAAVDVKKRFKFNPQPQPQSFTN